MNYRIVRMPKTEQGISDIMASLGAYIDGMYTEQEVKAYGPMNFNLAQFFSAWDNNAAIVAVAENDDSEITAVVIASLGRDMFSGQMRLDASRHAERRDHEGEVRNVLAYLKSCQAAIGYDTLHVTDRSVPGEETKILIPME